MSFFPLPLPIPLIWIYFCFLLLGIYDLVRFFYQIWAEYSQYDYTHNIWDHQFAKHINSSLAYGYHNIRPKLYSRQNLSQIKEIDGFALQARLVLKKSFIFNIGKPTIVNKYYIAINKLG